MSCWLWIFFTANFVFVVRYVNTQTITSGPRDVSGVLGGSQRLYCTVTDVSYSTILLWQVPRGDVLINHQAEIPSIYETKISTEIETVDDIRNELKYTLIINDLQDEDHGEYQCKVLLNSNVVGVESANVFVMNPSNNGIPTCFANPSGELYSGERVTLTCISSSSTADLVWRSNGRHLPTTASTKYAASTSEFSFTVSEDGQKYSCVSISQNTQCSLILSVQYKPEVQISLTAKQVELGETVGFSCDAVGNPSSFTYNWFYSGVAITEYDRTNGFQLNENGKILTLPKVTTDDNDVILTCVVSNGFGEGAAEYLIATVEGKSLIDILGPILVCVIVFFILLILIVFTTWYCRQKNTIKQIKKKEMVRRAESAKRKRQNGSVIIPVRGNSRFGGYTNSAYLSDFDHRPNRENDDDDDRLRPIPRRKSESSSIGKKGSIESSMSDYIVQDMPTTEDEDNLEKHYVYQVNPHFGELNGRRGSYTVNREDFETSLPSEIDSEDIDSIIPSTDL